AACTPAARASAIARPPARKKSRLSIGNPIAPRRCSSCARMSVTRLTQGLHFCNPPCPPAPRGRIGEVQSMRGSAAMKILIVEDEVKTGDYLRQGLREAGFVVDLARDGVDGLHLALDGDYHLIVLDVMLPSLDGWGILQTLRHSGRETPVLFLTARDQVEDRVRGLELGADDYLVKPFAFSEFLARVRTLLRRGRSQEPEVLRSSNLELDLLRRRVIRSGQRIDLTAKEFALLELLLDRKSTRLNSSHVKTS